MTDGEKTMLGDGCVKSVKVLCDALDAEKAIVVSDGAAAGSHVEMIPDIDVRIKAASMLLDRRYGKPSQGITGEEGGPIHIVGVDLNKLSVTQLEALRDMVKAATGDGDGEP